MVCNYLRKKKLTLEASINTILERVLLQLKLNAIREFRCFRILIVNCVTSMCHAKIRLMAMPAQDLGLSSLGGLATWMDYSVVWLVLFFYFCL